MSTRPQFADQLDRPATETVAGRVPTESAGEPPETGPVPAPPLVVPAAAHRWLTEWARDVREQTVSLTEAVLNLLPYGEIIGPLAVQNVRVLAIGVCSKNNWLLRDLDALADRQITRERARTILRETSTNHADMANLLNELLGNDESATEAGAGIPLADLLTLQGRGAQVNAVLEAYHAQSALISKANSFIIDSTNFTLMQDPTNPESRSGSPVPDPTEPPRWPVITTRLYVAGEEGRLDSELTHSLTATNEQFHPKISALGEVVMKNLALRQAKAELDEAVHAAVDAKASWADLGRVLGSDAISVARKWDPETRRKDKERHRNRKPKADDS